MKFSLLAVVAALMAQPSSAFQTPLHHRQRAAPFPMPVSVSSASTSTATATSSALFRSLNNDDNNNNQRKSRLARVGSFVFKHSRKPLALLTPFAVGMVGNVLLQPPVAAHASAPVMAKPKTQTVDPGEQALRQQAKMRRNAAQNELNAYTQKCRDIENEQGPAARATYEKQYKAQKEQEAADRIENFEQLKRDLLAQGICPFTDIEGQRQIIKFDTGVDMGTVAGTQYNKEARLVAKGSKKSWQATKQAHRAIVKCIAQDLRNRGMDEVAYFQQHTAKTEMIFDLPVEQALVLGSKYNANLEQYGQLTVPKEGELSVKEQMALRAETSGDAKAAAKEAKAKLKAEAKAEKEAIKRAKQEEKAAAKQAKAEAKVAAKQAKENSKAAAIAASAAAAAAGTAALSGATTAASAAANSMDAITAPTTPEVISQSNDGSAYSDMDDSIDGEGSAVSETPAAPVTVTPTKKSSMNVAKIAAVVVTIGGGAYGFKMMRGKAADDEEERQRQLDLLMQGVGEEFAATKSNAVDAEVDDAFDFEDDEDDDVAPTKSSAVTPVAPVDTTALPKKKRRGIKMFGKKKNDRESDITRLVADGAKAPNFSKTLAKLLTFGAPGRFPKVVALPGDMPLTEFDTEKANAALVEVQTEAGLSKEESAELFADVVNCMLIDIVDLASASLKEKDSKVTVNALSIVVDFMNHAASLFNSIAEGVAIKPVTYGGDLSKKQLEQMYGAYAVSGMMGAENIEDDFDNRVALLQDVFQINEKKAEGIVMKATQKNMMDMLKDGKGMEEMMAKMGGMEGMAGLEGLAGGMPGADGKEMSPEQLKEMLLMLKQLKDSGAIPDSELETVKKEFKESFGASIDEVMKENDDASANGELRSEDKELYELMKAILED